MKKFILLILMVIGSFSTFAQTPSYEEKAQTQSEEKSKKVTTVTIFILSGILILSFGVWAADRYMKKIVEQEEVVVKVEVEDTEVRNTYQKIRLLVLNAFEAHREAIKMGIKDYKNFEAVYRQIVLHDDQLSMNPSNAEMKAFIDAFHAVEKDFREALGAFTYEYGIYKTAKKELSQLDTATGYTNAYTEILGDGFKPILSSSQEYNQLLDKYAYLIDEHLSLRNELNDSIKSLKTEEVKTFLKSLLKNVEYVKTVQTDIINFQTNEKRRVDLADRGKSLIRKKAERLLSYCDESSSTKKECDDARQIIEDALEKSCEFKADDLVGNYGLYLQLMTLLDGATTPYKNDQEKTKQAAFSTKGDVGSPSLTNVSIGYGLGDMQI